MRSSNVAVPVLSRGMPAAEKVQRLQTGGDTQLIVFTCRSPELEQHRVYPS